MQVERALSVVVGRGAGAVQCSAGVGELGSLMWRSAAVAGAHTSEGGQAGHSARLINKLLQIRSVQFSRFPENKENHNHNLIMHNQPTYKCQNNTVNNT